MTVHGLCGLPRAGTTLIGNILAQHPDVHVTGTSLLAQAVEAVQQLISREPEVQSELAAGYDTFLGAYRGLITGWHAGVTEPMVVNKGRAWIAHPALLAQLDPAARIICCVRDPRAVVASIIAADERSAAFTGPLGQTAEQIAANAMQPNGMVGAPVRFIDDAIRRRSPNVHIVRYESLVVDPAHTIRRLAAALELTPFEFDLDAVENVSPDVDTVWRNKFPHTAAGPVKAQPSAPLAPDIAQRVAATVPFFMQTFYGR